LTIRAISLLNVDLSTYILTAITVEIIYKEIRSYGNLGKTMTSPKN